MRFAFRSLLKSPGYTLIALITLALGIGVNTSMVSTIEALLFRTGPFPAPHELVQVVARPQSGQEREYSALELRELRERTTAFTALTTIGRTAFAMSEQGQPAERIGAVLVSDDFFATFRMQPMLGRSFRAEEYLPGGNRVVVLSHLFWQNRFAGDPNILGHTVRLDGDTVTIIGVMPPAFDDRMLWRWCALWRPLNFTKDQLEWRDYRVFQLIGRLRPEATRQQVMAELAPLAAAQAKEHPDAYTGLRYQAVPLQEALMDKLGRRISWMLLGLSGFVLLIACANLANLQLARTTLQARELAIRAALGASRRHLLVQQLTESLLVAFGGGSLALAVAYALNRVLEAYLASAGWASGIPLTLNPRVLLVTLAVSLLTGLAFGLMPAWFASRVDANTALKQQVRGSTTGRGHHRVRQTLIVVEVALALVLLAGAAVLQRGFAQLLRRSPGWDSDRVLIGSLPVPETRISTNAQRMALYRSIETHLAAIPGVEHAAIATSLPVTSYTGERAVLTLGQTAADAGRQPAAFHTMVSPDFFATLGLRLIQGRLFPAEVKPGDAAMVIVNQALARRLWPNQNPIGQRLGSMDSGDAYWAEVIGVVSDADTVASMADPLTPYVVYKPLAQEPWGYVNLVLRGVPGLVRVDSLGNAMRQAVASVDPDLVVDNIGSVRQLTEREQANVIVATKLLSGFALLGLGLALVGLYGVISQLVAQRTPEFGIRLALGAKPGDVLALVLRHGLQLVSFGTVVGLAGAFALTRVLGALMPRLAHLDVLSLSAVALLLLAVSLLACWAPARRATRVDPMIALRAE